MDMDYKEISTHYPEISNDDFDRLAEAERLVLLRNLGSEQRANGGYAVNLLMLICEGPAEGETFRVTRVGKFAADVRNNITEGRIKAVRLTRSATGSGTLFSAYHLDLTAEDRETVRRVVGQHEDEADGVASQPMPKPKRWEPNEMEAGRNHTEEPAF